MTINKSRLFLRGNGDGRRQLQKLVITSFVGLPDGRSLHYLELCGRDLISFELAADEIVELADVGFFYRDTRASNAMYDQYRNIDPRTGRHHQTIGDDSLTVIPASSAFTEVAPRPGEGAKCYDVNVNVAGWDESAPDESWGAWIRITQKHPRNWVRAASQEVRLDLVVRQFDIKNFYWFVILPSGYRSLNEQFRLEEYPRKLQHSDLEAQAVMEYRLPSDFSVYSEWAPRIYRRSILKNRRSLTIDRDGLTTINFQAIDDTYSSRLSTASFLGGVALSLAANGVISIIFYGIGRRFSIITISVLIALSIVTVAATWIGWRNLVSHR